MTAAQKSAVKKANALLNGTSVEPIKVTRTRKAAAKPAAKATKPAARKPAAKPAAKPVADKGSVTGTFTLTKMAAKNGGHRFEVENDRAFSPFYMDQGEWAAIGSPKRIRVNVTAL